MKTELKKSLSINKTLLILSLMTLLLGVMSCLLGEAIIALLIGPLSALYLFDTRSKRSVSIIVSLLLLAMNFISIFIGLAVSLFAPAAIILAIMLSYAFAKGHSKSDVSYLMTVIASLLVLCGYLLFAMMERDIFTLEAAVEFYTVFIENLREVFVGTMMDIYSASGVEITADIVGGVFDQQINMTISYFLILGFAITGIGMKLFSTIVRRLSSDSYAMREWRFGTTRAYAYFYVALVIASIFTLDASSVFAITVLNLYNFFMVVFAYVGYKVAREILSTKMKPWLATLIIIAVVLVFASFGAQILAALGTLYSLRSYSDPTHNTKR